MTTITLVRTPAPLPDALGDTMAERLRGMDDVDRAAWARFWRRIEALEAGEIIEITIRNPRNGAFHRKFFALLKVGFDAWQPPRKRLTYKGRAVAKSFDAFRAEVIILAGYYVQTFDLRGRMKLEPQSISFAKMDQQQFEALYSAAADVLLAAVLRTYHGRAELDAVVERIMSFT